MSSRWKIWRNSLVFSMSHFVCFNCLTLTAAVYFACYSHLPTQLRICKGSDKKSVPLIRRFSLFLLHISLVILRCCSWFLNAVSRSIHKVNKQITIPGAAACWFLSTGYFTMRTKKQPESLNSLQFNWSIVVTGATGFRIIDARSTKSTRLQYRFKLWYGQEAS